MSIFEGIGPLLSAARALQGSEGQDIRDQINFVSNALIQGHRERRLIVEGKDLPKEVINVFENIKIQMEQVVIPNLAFERDDQAFYKVSQALIILENFTDRVIQHFHALHHGSAQEAKWCLERAKFATDSMLKLKKLYERIEALTDQYMDNPKMPLPEFQKGIQQITSAIEAVEKEFIVEKETPDFLVIFAHIDVLKEKLENAIALANQPEHPKIVGEMALSLLRVASDMIQRAKDQFVIQQALEMASKANEKLKKSSEYFLASAVKFNRIIQAKVASFVHRQLLALEREVKKPIVCSPTETKETERIIETMLRQKERTITYFEMAKGWSGHRQEDFFERIALLFEKITERAEKADRLFLEVANSTVCDEKRESLLKQASKFQKLAKLGGDIIKPHEIFSSHSH